MCGIVGVVGKAKAAPLLLDGLRRLEYRGYDSAGVATLVNGHIERRRAEGKLANLAAALERSPLPGVTGIGHTRWATHGAPTETNAHPHGTARVAIVHNGIIENHAELRAALEEAGQEFSTDTDTETVAQLVDHYLAQGVEAEAAAPAAFARLEGAYALALIFAGRPELMIGVRRGAPLAVGYGEDEMYLGSDALALAPLTRRIAYLEDGDWVVINRAGAVFHDQNGKVVHREVKQTRFTGATIGKGNFRHFMEKELHEHPVVIGDVLHRMIDSGSRMPVLPALPFALADVVEGHNQRLRFGLLCRLDGAVLAGEFGARAGGRRRGERVPLSRAADGAGRPWVAGQPVRRNSGHAGGAAVHESAGPKHPVGAECAGKQHGA